MAGALVLMCALCVVVGLVVGAGAMAALWAWTDRRRRIVPLDDRRVLSALVTLTERARSFTE